VRITSESARAYYADLSRRLRDGALALPVRLSTQNAVISISMPEITTATRACAINSRIVANRKLSRNALVVNHARIADWASLRARTEVTTAAKQFTRLISPSDNRPLSLCLKILFAPQRRCRRKRKDRHPFAANLFVSVVVPLDNDLDILPAVVREIDAVMQSHFGDYELIFIDDGSTDETVAMLERFGDRIRARRGT